MEISPSILALIIITLLVLPPVVLFRPLVNSIADRIAGKRPGAKELAEVQKRVAMLESEVNEMRNKYEALEDAQDFSRKLLEDIHFKSGDTKPAQIADSLSEENEALGDKSEK